jgi:hypothetical protein
MISRIPSSKFALKQLRFLKVLTNRLQELDDPNPDVITHDSYEYHETCLKGIGVMPKITFKPYGKSTQIKAEIMRSANIDDESRKREIDEIRKKYGIKTARDTETRILARLFESYWNNYWRSIRTALSRIEQAQRLFITNPERNETVSKPMRIMLGNAGVFANKQQEIEESQKEKKSYAEELINID